MIRRQSAGSSWTRRPTPFGRGSLFVSKADSQNKMCSPSLRDATSLFPIFYSESKCYFSFIANLSLGEYCVQSHSDESAMFLQSVAGVQRLASALSHLISISMTLGVKTRAWKCEPSPCQESSLSPSVLELQMILTELKVLKTVIELFNDVSLEKKHCWLLKPQDLTCFFLQRHYPFIRHISKVTACMRVHVGESPYGSCRVPLV